jgi:hypothetical protein
MAFDLLPLPRLTDVSRRIELDWDSLREAGQLLMVAELWFTTGV